LEEEKSTTVDPHNARVLRVFVDRKENSHMVKFVIWGVEGALLLLVFAAVYSQLIRPLLRNTPVFPFFRNVSVVEEQIEVVNESLDIKAQQRELEEKKRKLED
jgi:hypothetical protein